MKRPITTAAVAVSCAAMAAGAPNFILHAAYLLVCGYLIASLWQHEGKAGKAQKGNPGVVIFNGNAVGAPERIAEAIRRSQ